MLRLALIGHETAPAYVRIAPRLRGGTLHIVEDEECDWNGPFDAVILCGRLRDRAAHCRQAAAAGKHVLAECPLALSAADAALAIDACARAGVRLMVGQGFRYLPSVQAIRASLDAGKLGEPGLLRVHRWEEGDPPLGLSREIDLACWLFGCWPSEVYAAGRRDYTQVHLGFPGGGMALIDHARSLPPGEGYYSLSLIGSTGAAYADDHHNTQLLFGRGQPTAHRTRQGDGHVLALVQEFIHAVEEKREPAVTGADGLRALEVAEAVAASLEKGQALYRDHGGYQIRSER